MKQENWLPFTLCIVVLICFGAVSALAEVQVGEVVSVTGVVRIDAYGTDRFIPARAGDSLFAKSRIRVDGESLAVIMISGETRELPGDTEVGIGSLLAVSDVRTRRGFFPGLMDAIKHIVLTIRDREEKKTLGGRAAEAKVETTVWMLDEEDDDVLFNQARELIEQESYVDALAKLNAILFAPESALPGEFDWLKGHSLFHLGLFEPAVDALIDSFEVLDSRARQPAQIPYFYPLLYELGLGLYLTGNPERSLTPLELYLAGESDMPAYGLAVYILALADSGQIRKAQATRKSALAEYSSTRYGTLFEATDP